MAAIQERPPIDIQNSRVWQELTPPQAAFAQVAVDFVNNVDPDRVNPLIAFGSISRALEKIDKIVELGKKCQGWSVLEAEQPEHPDILSRLSGRAVAIGEAKEVWEAGYEVMLAKNGVEKVLYKIAGQE